MRKELELAKNLRRTLRFLGVPIKGPTRILCENESVFKQIFQPRSALENKAIGTTYHFVRESYTMSPAEIFWISGKDSPANILMNTSSGPVFHKNT